MKRTEAPRTPTDEPRIVAGKLVGVFGIRGQVMCAPTRVGEDAIVPGARLWMDGDAAGLTQLIVRSLRRSRGRIVLELENVTTVEQAQLLVGKTVGVARGAANLAAGEYLDDDLVGLQLVDESGQVLGVVSGISHFPAQDCLVVQPHGALVPMVSEFIRVVDVPARRIVVRVPPGLIDDALAERA